MATIRCTSFIACRVGERSDGGIGSCVAAACVLPRNCRTGLLDESKAAAVNIGHLEQKSENTTARKKNIPRLRAVSEQKNRGRINIHTNKQEGNTTNEPTWHSVREHRGDTTRGTLVYRKSSLAIHLTWRRQWAEGGQAIIKFPIPKRITLIDFPFPERHFSVGSRRKSLATAVVSGASHVYCHQPSIAIAQECMLYSYSDESGHHFRSPTLNQIKIRSIHY
jgi:hypothetical protein